MNNRPAAPTHDNLNEPALQHAHRDFARILTRHTVAEALAEVRASALESRIVYFYAVDDEGRLEGVVPTRRLLLSPPETRVEDLIVRRIVALPENATLLEACELFIMHRLLALPIVDHQRRILGVIDVDQYTDEIRQLDEREESDDIFQLIGVRLAQVQQASVPAMFRSRFPWLLCNVAGGVACAFVAGAFEGVLDEVVAIALFIPVVLTLAESVSIQSLTLAIQLQSRSPMAGSVLLRTVVRELPLGLLLGAACGALVGGIALVWQRNGGVAACILASISLSVMLAALFGLLVPALLHQLRRDPTVAAGPIALALTDVATTVTYLGLATCLL